MSTTAMPVNRQSSTGKSKPLLTRRGSESIARSKRTIKRKVRDYQQKLTAWLMIEFDVVAVEDLDVKPMLEDSQNATNKQGMVTAS